MTPDGVQTVSRASLVRAVRELCDGLPHAVLFDEASEALVDLASGKAIRLSVGDVAEMASRKNAVDGRPYLVLRLHSGVQVVLAAQGLAFAPLPSGQSPEALSLPPVVCLRDFQTVRARLAHEIEGHPDDPPSVQALEAMMICIAVLDGARAVGFDVSREERELDALLTAIERKGKAGG